MTHSSTPFGRAAALVLLGTAMALPGLRSVAAAAAGDGGSRPANASPGAQPAAEDEAAARKELRDPLDPSGRPVRVSGGGSIEEIAKTPVTPGADPSYADDPLPRGAAVIDAASQIREIKRRHFGSVRDQALRDEGIAKLKAFREPSSITAMYEELRSERDDVVLGMLDHLAGLQESGQAALAWMAIMDANPALRHEAAGRIVRPATAAALGVIDAALRSNSHVIANRAGSLAGTIGATPLVPLLMAAQTTESAADAKGDLAWIAIQTQRSYVANVVPVAGNNAGAFQPIIGVIGEGALLRIMDAVVISYRTEVHTALVGITSADWGRSTEYLGYDRLAWQRWFNEEYKPFLARREAEAARVAKAKQLEREAAEQEE